MRSRLLVALVFSLSLASYVYRGPYLALRSDSGDFATVYGAARAWTRGLNPYDHAELNRQLAEAGGPAALKITPLHRPSVYFLPAMPVAAIIASLPWRSARVLWCVLSAIIMAGGVLYVVLRNLPLTHSGKWLCASVILVLATPGIAGLRFANPGMLVIGLTAFAIQLALENRWNWSGLLLGAALCLKPQIAICGLAALALWRKSKPVVIGASLFALSGFIAAAQARSTGTLLVWIRTQQANILQSLAPGAVNDPSPAHPESWQLLNLQVIVSLFVHSRRIADLVVWAFAVLAIATFFVIRKNTAAPSFWRDLAFICAIDALVAYHRNYDAELFVALIPFVFELWREHRRELALLIATPLALLLSSYETLLSKLMNSPDSNPGLAYLLLARLPAFAVVTLTVLTIVAELTARRKLGNHRDSPIDVTEFVR
ncbi:MAG: DUF2029 domain-containing protein [Acidobacteriaceae bacterium]|nr:DUF2029 domain-containing protein [Acidobacteriaceae bacterium]